MLIRPFVLCGAPLLFCFVSRQVGISPCLGFLLFFVVLAPLLFASRGFREHAWGVFIKVKFLAFEGQYPLLPVCAMFFPVGWRYPFCACCLVRFRLLSYLTVQFLVSCSLGVLRGASVSQLMGLWLLVDLVRLSHPDRRRDVVWVLRQARACLRTMGVQCAHVFMRSRGLGVVERALAESVDAIHAHAREEAGLGQGLGVIERFALHCPPVPGWRGGGTAFDRVMVTVARGLWCAGAGGVLLLGAGCALFWLFVFLGATAAKASVSIALPALAGPAPALPAENRHYWAWAAAQWSGFVAALVAAERVLRAGASAVATAWALPHGALPHAVSALGEAVRALLVVAWYSRAPDPSLFLREYPVAAPVRVVPGWPRLAEGGLEEDLVAGRCDRMCHTCHRNEFPQER